MKAETNLKIFITAFVLSLFFSLIVSLAAVLLKPVQTKNEEIDRNKNIFEAAGITVTGDNKKLSTMKTYYYDIAEGKITGKADVNTYFRNFKRIINDPERSIDVTNSELPGIKRIPKKIPFYIFYKEDKIDCIVLPVFGNGLWSTMYGFVGINGDGNTIRGLTFYDQKETPGLGGEVDNPVWKKQWNGKNIYSENNELKISVIKGKVDPAKPSAVYEVDGLSGASMTTSGVNTFIRFWLDNRRFGKLLKEISERGKI